MPRFWSDILGGIFDFYILDDFKILNQSKETKIHDSIEKRGKYRYATDPIQKGEKLFQEELLEEKYILSYQDNFFGLVGKSDRSNVKCYESKFIVSTKIIERGERLRLQQYIKEGSYVFGKVKGGFLYGLVQIVVILLLMVIVFAVMWFIYGGD